MNGDLKPFVDTAVIPNNGFLDRLKQFSFAGSVPKIL